jgi:trehalose-phosphatase
MGFSETAPWLTSIKRRLDRPMVLFLDFDGTLVRIAERPDLAVLDPKGKKLLLSLVKRVPTVIISGRALHDVKSRVGIGTAVYVGNHGLEIEGINIKYNMKNASQWLALLKKLSSSIRKTVGAIPGIIIEDKIWTLSIHYRLVSGASRQKARRLFLKAVRGFRGEDSFRVTHGKAVWEIRPPDEWNKGKAVAWLLNQPGYRRRWPLYLGDDRTDQDALKVVRRGGVGIWVGAAQEKGAARFSLDNPRDVRQFLRWFLGQVSQKIGRMKKI